MKSLTFILRYPWGLYENEHRHPLDELENIQSANWPLILATTSQVSVRLKNRRVPPQSEGVPFNWGQHQMQFFSIPSVTHLERQKMVIFVTDQNRIRYDYPVNIIDSVARPKDTINGEDIGFGTEADCLTGLLKTMFARIQDIIDAAMETESGKKRLRLSWERVAEKMLENRLDAPEPYMDLIVKHANQLHKTVTATAEKPRRVLNRVRRSMSVPKIQELDSACLMDYIRRPGITPAQKAGPRQVLLGIDREETYDTVENRVLKDFLKRSCAMSQMYLRAFSKYKSSSRYLIVQKYAMACRRLVRDHAFEKVSHMSVRPTANYVLLFDPAYHKIWIAYEELLKHDNYEDDAWRWQQRLWADLGKILIHSSLVWVAPVDGGIPAISPLYLRLEQSRGRWTDEIPQSAFFLLDSDAKKVVAAPVDTMSSLRHPKIQDWQLSLGVTMVIHLEEVWGGRKASILVWTLHSTGVEQPDIGQAVASAEDSLSKCLNHVKTYEDMNLSSRGIILLSNRDLEASPTVEDSRLVSGVCFAPSNAGISKAIELVGDRIQRFVSELFR